MYYRKELCVRLVTYQKFYRDARSAEYKILACLTLKVTSLRFFATLCTICPTT